MRRIQSCIFYFAILCSLALVTGCFARKGSIVYIWTDQSDFASYAELFNSTQKQFKAVIIYKENPAEALISAAKDKNAPQPDIIIGAWLKGEKVRARLSPIDYLFNELRIPGKQFYQPLLDLGNIHGRQYLLPVSFNLPALVFSAENAEYVPTNFNISLDQIRDASKRYNSKKGNSYTRMGFSPRWNFEFMYLAAKLHQADFEESAKLFAFDKGALEKTIRFIRNWSVTINDSTTAENDFEFRYLYDPPYKLATGKRNLFSYISSQDLLVLSQDKLQNIDFRWISQDGRTPINDNIIYAGITKKAKNLDAAEAFIVWFYNDDTQKYLIERNKNMGTMERSFGISGGFSSIRSVNEKIFPLYYPLLLAHLPPAESLSVPRILPSNWETIKEEIVLPWLIDSADNNSTDSLTELDARIANWLKTQ